MDIIIFALGMIIGGALSGAIAYLIGRTQRTKKEIEIEEQEREEERKIKKQFDNFFSYDGTTKNQEAIE